MLFGDDVQARLGVWLPEAFEDHPQGLSIYFAAKHVMLNMHACGAVD